MYWAISLLKTRKPDDNGSDLLQPKDWENSIIQEAGPALQRHHYRLPNTFKIIHNLEGLRYFAYLLKLKYRKNISKSQLFLFNHNNPKNEDNEQNLQDPKNEGGPKNNINLRI